MSRKIIDRQHVPGCNEFDPHSRLRAMWLGAAPAKRALGSTNLPLITRGWIGSQATYDLPADWKASFLYSMEAAEYQEDPVDVQAENGGTVDDYAMGIADGSYGWYRSHAIRSRKMYKSTEALIIIASAAIPIADLLASGRTVVPSFIAAGLFVLVGLRSIYHWRDNYLRYSYAREAVEAERRLFHTRASPYGDPETRAQLLVAAVSRIEQEEMGTWLKTVAVQDEPRRQAGRSTDRSTTSND